MVPRQDDRILDAIDELDRSVEKLKDEFHKSLEQTRSETARNESNKEAQALINTKVREDHTYLKEKVQGDGNKGLEEKGRDQERSTETLSLKVDAIDTKVGELKALILWPLRIIASVLLVGLTSAVVVWVLGGGLAPK